MTPSQDQRVAEREAAGRLFEQLPKGDLLLPYQRRTVDILFGGISLLVIEKSRRIGLTWGMAAYAALRAATAGNEGFDAWYMGYNLDMAREFVEDCAMWAKAFGIAAEAVDQEVLAGDGEKVQAFRIRFSSGYKVTGLPSAARVLRGKQGLVIVDEAAFHTNLEEVLKAAFALLMWGGQVVVVSTHDGVSNPFNVLVDDIRAGRRKGEVLRITFDQALQDGLFERIALTGRNRGKSKEEWVEDVRSTYGDNAEEELDCIPKAGSGSLIAPEDLAAAEHPDAGKPELYSGGLLYVGRDVARRRDGAIIWGFELVGDVLWLRDRWESYGPTPFYEQDAAMDALFDTRRVAAVGIDQTGMGEKVVEDAQRRWGENRIHGVLLTGPNRLVLATALLIRFQRGLIRIPADPKIRADLRAIKKTSGPTGQVRLVNDGEVHADMFWAAGLACNEAMLPPALYEYQGIARPDPFGKRVLVEDDDDFTRRANRPFEREAPGSLGQLRGGGCF